MDGRCTRTINLHESMCQAVALGIVAVFAEVEVFTDLALEASSIDELPAAPVTITGMRIGAFDGSCYRIHGRRTTDGDRWWTRTRRTRNKAIGLGPRALDLHEPMSQIMAFGGVAVLA